jgi:FADH2 O2-dependent halogenase
LYSHITGVKRWADLHPSSDVTPYPVDAAAVHHVFEGGWMWVLRFNNGLTSAGVAISDEARAKLGSLDLGRAESSWKRLLEKFPSIQAQFAGAQPTEPFVHARPMSFLSGEMFGRNWALLPSAAGFVDPLLSTGFPLTLLGIERLAAILETRWGRDDIADDLCRYSMQTTIELATVERLVAALYATMHDFELFSALTLLYFAAASFTEAARRLGKPELAGKTFLLGENALFNSPFRSCLDAALQRPSGAARSELLALIQRTIEPVNIAGLGRAARLRWYPADAADLLAGAHKLQSTRAEVEAMLERCGFRN